MVAVLAGLAGYSIRNALLVTRPPAATGETVLKAAFDDLSGHTQTIGQWRGKVVVVNFWATWCPPCLREIPDFIQMQNDYGDRGLQFVGIAIDRPEKVQAFAANAGFRFNYPVLVGALEAIELSRVLGNRQGALPFTVVVDRAGKLSAVNLGALDAAKLSKIIQPLL